ncbi:MAG: ADP-ribosylglycohydrolase family protein [Clostridia bacterium]|nr:ADP-ribosylglycohydrolase family protein [Clostridia bacterium]
MKAIINDRILGCLTGGAAGDALGYAVEFSGYDSIISEYGKDGITAYSLSAASGKALISDDTQMTLFTAEGLLKQEGKKKNNIYKSYLNWFKTQNCSFEEYEGDGKSHLMTQKELFARRAPGLTCLSALASNNAGGVYNPINNSKGCGGVMRVAPIAFLQCDAQEGDLLAAEASAITHGHNLGFLPSALLVHIIRKAIYENSGDRSLKEIITESVEQIGTQFAAFEYFDDMISLVQKSVSLSENGKSDIENIRALGEGWVAEETLAIAVYCSLRHSGDFAATIKAAVNHSGDSDSTGAVAGNIAGAYLGDAAIGAHWKDSLECYDIIKTTAEKFYV